METFHVDINDAEIADLRERLRRTRWPDHLDGTGWELGTDTAFVQQLCHHWSDAFDWDGFHERCNRHPQVRTEVNGTTVHAIVAPSTDRNATPLLLLHGWPGSAAEYFDVIEPLRRDHHVVVASLPGYGFSGPTTRRGIEQLEIGRNLVELMRRLGYERFVIAGSDWGANIGSWMAGYVADAVVGLHMTMVPMLPPTRDGSEAVDGVTDAEWGALDRARQRLATDAGYAAIQSTRPQTIAHGLTDSPAGLAAWIVEKFHGWSDCDGATMNAFSMDRLLDNISIYWFTGTINSSMRLYFEALSGGRPLFSSHRVDAPTAIAAYPGDIYPMPRSWAERQFRVVRWQTMPRGGHFPAMEVPELYADDVDNFTRKFARRC